MKKLFATSVALAAALSFSSAHAASGKLVLYTSQPDKDAAKTVAAFNSVEPNVTVEWIRSGTTEVMNKLRAEIAAGDPKPDVLLIADVVNMESLKRDGHLLAYKGAPVGPYSSDTYDADMTYFGTKLITTGIMYHTSAKIKPTSWKDLIRPEVRGLVTMPSPLYSGAAAIHMGAITRSEGLGWDYYEKLAANDTVPVKGNGAVLRAVSGGQKVYGIVVEFIVIRSKGKGAPIEFVFPNEGVSAVTEPVAILKTGKNPEAAKAFIDFILSEDGQRLAVSQGYLPAHPGVGSPPGFPDVSKIKLLPMDAGAILSTAGADKERFAKLFGG